MAIARFVIIALFAVSSALALPNLGRILEGNAASSGQHPWVASVRVDNAHVCCGSIIANNYVLTAAHCVSQISTTPLPASSVSVRVGSVNQYAGGQIVKVESIKLHQSYGNFLHDLALIKLAAPLTWSEKIRSIELANQAEEIEAGTDLTVTGWGLQLTGASPYNLQETKLKSLSREDCDHQAGYGYVSVICLSHAEKQGICRGDDGAGAVVGNKLVGVLSFAFGACGTKYPDVAAKVSYYNEWIQENVK